MTQFFLDSTIKELKLFGVKSIIFMGAVLSLTNAFAGECGFNEINEWYSDPFYTGEKTPDDYGYYNDANGDGVDENDYSMVVTYEVPLEISNCFTPDAVSATITNFGQPVEEVTYGYIQCLINLCEDDSDSERNNEEYQCVEVPPSKLITLLVPPTPEDLGLSSDEFYIIVEWSAEAQEQYCEGPAYIFSIYYFVDDTFYERHIDFDSLVCTEIPGECV